MKECRNCKSECNYNKIKQQYFDYCSIECRNKNSPKCNKCDKTLKYDKNNKKYFDNCSCCTSNYSVKYDNCVYSNCNKCGELHCYNNSIKNFIFNNCSCSIKTIIISPFYPTFEVTKKPKRIFRY